MHHHLELRTKIIIMLSVMASLFLVALDQTIIATALGRIVEEFNAFDSLSWIVTAYLLTTTITVPIAGKLSDLFGRRTILLIGVAIFAAGSLFSGLAGNVDQLIAWRAIQGVGGGIIIDGKLYSGSNYAGAELGHMVIVKDGQECGCGRKGCWEAYASANALIRMTKEAIMNENAETRKAAFSKAKNEYEIQRDSERKK